MVRETLQIVVVVLLVEIVRMCVYPGPPVRAQCSAPGRFTFASATHVDMPVAPMPGFIAACYNTAGVQIASTTITVPNPTLVQADFASPQTGYCVVK
jgi:hypothetical protein